MNARGLTSYSSLTRDVEDLVAWLVTKTDKTTVSGFVRVSWRTVGAICERVAADVLDPDRLCGLVDIGVDEISWRKHHRYLTLVSDHDTGKIIWGKAGKDTEVDHIVSVAKLGVDRGRGNDPANLQAVCPCHRRKSRREAAEGSAAHNRTRAAARRAGLRVREQ